MHLNRFHSCLSGLLGWMLAVVPLFAVGQIRDTVSIRGFKFLFAETTLELQDEKIQEINLVRLDPGSSKWLLKHTLHQESADCNSVQAELGGYHVTDTSIVFYTVWMSSTQAMAGISGVRKQTYEVTATGKVRSGPCVLWVECGPQHPCIRDLSSGIDDLFGPSPSRKQVAEQKLYMHCMEAELGGKFAMWKDKQSLVTEGWTALEREIRQLRKRYEGLSFPSF